MESKPTRRRNNRVSIYSRCLMNRKVVLPFTEVGNNLSTVIEEYVSDHFEGKCLAEGYVKPRSTRIIRYSCGTIERGNNVVFDVVFECEVCFLVEGMLISCIAKSIVKAGIRVESATESPSPIVGFIAKDHHHDVHAYSEVKEGDTIMVRVIGQRFELNDKYVSIIGELVRDKVPNRQKTG